MGLVPGRACPKGEPVPVILISSMSGGQGLPPLDGCRRIARSRDTCPNPNGLDHDDQSETWQSVRRKRNPRAPIANMAMRTIPDLGESEFSLGVSAGISGLLGAGGAVFLLRDGLSGASAAKFFIEFLSMSPSETSTDSVIENPVEELRTSTSELELESLSDSLYRLEFITIIKMNIQRGRKSLRELQQSLDLAQW
ncbi:hypothetical protein MAR_018559 [Mya arenaria]|uniref:Uncharacterized protein n=1 Tax=Mya arenaria TaxID=6604 RepID=A0ABY7EIG8_MYAAR|nr:hypothetical protein MAR_018559 [Mya arenaria]